MEKSVLVLSVVLSAMVFTSCGVTYTTLYADLDHMDFQGNIRHWDNVTLYAEEYSMGERATTYHGNNINGVNFKTKDGECKYISGGIITLSHIELVKKNSKDVNNNATYNNSGFTFTDAVRYNGVFLGYDYNESYNTLIHLRDNGQYGVTQRVINQFTYLRKECKSVEERHYNKSK